MQQRLAAEAAAEVQRQELQQCRQWLQHGKRGGMSQCECSAHAEMHMMFTHAWLLLDFIVYKCAADFTAPRLFCRLQLTASTPST